MIIGAGVDFVRISRFRDWVLNEDKMRRFLSEQECRYCLEDSGDPAASIAARFAAREAFAKALGTGIGQFVLKEIAVCSSGNGRPHIELLGGAAVLFEKVIADLGFRHPRIHLSMSHDADYAMAYVVIEGEL